MDRLFRFNAKVKDEVTPLCKATFFGHKETVELLIAEGARVNKKDDFGNTAIFEVYCNDHREIAELLIKNGADVNAKTLEFERTPLYYAAEKGHKEIAEILILNGAKVNAIDKDGFTPFDISYCHKETKELLKRYGGVSSSSGCVFVVIVIMIISLLVTSVIILMI